ncbi:PREDICTED: uncharacterized protein LOC109116607 [Tarenaya hassleriana]|uniref:uncharacterized protein LOC109116607 n=1 Tax=Tarenaya hassleriana TaxID=28532 RepID=UPI0008FD1A6D|nr:PREDICTED: uncharacterized protein LOC109116607 [Tarenaya hassleriana]
MENGNNSLSAVSREKLDQVATWVSIAVVSAFFSSLERCSCVNLTTTDLDDEEDVHFDPNGRPLTLSRDMV